jgi:16S rRNA (cytidine1402-2'-O)-methyltransferase
METARLFVIATPIGNLQDITLRALEVLAQADVVAAEDTRRTRLLLSHHGIDRPLAALHEHNEDRQAPHLIKRMLGGESVALVSDAGTPLLSDPGFRLVRLAAENGIEVVAVPGASAVTAALSVSGLPTDRFVFEGFLPAKSAARLKKLQALSGETGTLVFFESSHRVLASLADMQAAFGDERPMAICRELTKQFETVLRGSLAEVRAAVEVDANQQKGEFVILVGGNDVAADTRMASAMQLAAELREHVGASQAARIASRIHDVPRREIYRSLESD